jgi:NitT/TauT family transport system substrate-binding protein
LEALRAGTIQGAALTIDEVVSLVSSGFAVKVVLVIDYSMGGDIILGQKEITHLDQLEGKTVGYEGSVVGEFLLQQALQFAGFNSSGLKLVNIPANEWLDAGSLKTDWRRKCQCFIQLSANTVSDH